MSDRTEETFNQALEVLRQQYRTQEPALADLRAYANGTLPDAESQAIEEILILRADLRAMVHYLRHPDPALDAAAAQAVQRALAALDAGTLETDGDEVDGVDEAQASPAKAVSTGGPQVTSGSSVGSSGALPSRETSRTSEQTSRKKSFFSVWPRWVGVGAGAALAVLLVLLVQRSGVEDRDRPELLQDAISLNKPLLRDGGVEKLRAGHTITLTRPDDGSCPFASVFDVTGNAVNLQALKPGWSKQNFVLDASADTSFVVLACYGTARDEEALAAALRAEIKARGSLLTGDNAERTRRVWSALKPVVGPSLKLQLSNLYEVTP